MDDASYRVTANELRQFIERYEHLDAEAVEIADQKKEVMAEAKARGYDPKVLKKVIALRKRDPNDVAEEEAILELYREALGLDVGTSLRDRLAQDREDDDGEGEDDWSDLI
jgi:uncharacterized protein (UPF0335 family)